MNKRDIKFLNYDHDFFRAYFKKIYSELYNRYDPLYCIEISDNFLPEIKISSIDGKVYYPVKDPNMYFLDLAALGLTTLSWKDFLIMFERVKNENDYQETMNLIFKTK